MKTFWIKENVEKNIKIGANAGLTNANDYGPPTSLGALDALIIFLKVPFIQYEQLLLSKWFRQCLETIMLSSKVLRMGIQKTPYQKTYELQAGSQ